LLKKCLSALKAVKALNEKQFLVWIKNFKEKKALERQRYSCIVILQAAYCFNVSSDGRKV